MNLNSDSTFSNHPKTNITLTLHILKLSSISSITTTNNMGNITTVPCIGGKSATYTKSFTENITLLQKCNQSKHTK